MALTLLAATLLTPLDRAETAPGGPLGGEFQVNGYDTDCQHWPAIGSDGDGDDGDALGVFGRRFEGGGGPAVASDFTADGRSDILWRNSDDGRAVAWQMNGFEKEATAQIGRPSSPWKVVDNGDVDGSGHADILWRNTSTGSTVIWQMMGLEMEAAAQIGIVSGDWQAVAVGDFDGDRKADTLWRNAGSGNTVIWKLSGLAKEDADSIGFVSGGWKVR